SHSREGNNRETYLKQPIMAVFIKLYQNKYNRQHDYGKWFARVVRTGETDIDRLAEHIEQNTTFKKGEVRGILIELVEEMKRELQAGRTVNLNGFGRFHLGVTSLSVDKPEDFHIGRHISGVKCKFVPAGRRNPNTWRINQVFSEGVEVKRLE
ncbi:MAG: HU family DNA-binding protein, partial [Prevotella sp.]